MQVNQRIGASLAAAAEMRGTNLVVLVTTLGLDVDELDGTGHHLYVENIGEACRYLGVPFDLLFAGLSETDRG